MTAKSAAAGWVREPGRGRLCHLANGHTLEALLHPMYQRLLRNAVRWCLHMEARMTDEGSHQLSQDEMSRPKVSCVLTLTWAKNRSGGRKTQSLKKSTQYTTHLLRGCYAIFPQPQAGIPEIFLIACCVLYQD